MPLVCSMCILQMPRRNIWMKSNVSVNCFVFLWTGPPARAGRLLQCRNTLQCRDSTKKHGTFFGANTSLVSGIPNSGQLGSKTAAEVEDTTQTASGQQSVLSNQEGTPAKSEETDYAPVPRSVSQEKVDRQSNHDHSAGTEREEKKKGKHQSSSKSFGAAWSSPTLGDNNATNGPFAKMPEEVFTCDVCDKSFAKQVTLDNHRKCHKGVTYLNMQDLTGSKMVLLDGKQVFLSPRVELSQFPDSKLDKRTLRVNDVQDSPIVKKTLTNSQNLDFSQKKLLNVKTYSPRKGVEKSASHVSPARNAANSCQGVYHLARSESAFDKAQRVKPPAKNMPVVSGRADKNEAQNKEENQAMNLKQGESKNLGGHLAKEVQQLKKEKFRAESSAKKKCSWSLENARRQGITLPSQTPPSGMAKYFRERLRLLLRKGKCSSQKESSLFVCVCVVFFFWGGGNWCGCFSASLGKEYAFAGFLPDLEKLSNFPVSRKFFIVFPLNAKNQGFPFWHVNFFHENIFFMFSWKRSCLAILRVQVLVEKVHSLKWALVWTRQDSVKVFTFQLSFLLWFVEPGAQMARKQAPIDMELVNENNSQLSDRWFAFLSAAPFVNWARRTCSVKHFSRIWPLLSVSHRAQWELESSTQLSPLLIAQVNLFLQRSFLSQNVSASETKREYRILSSQDAALACRQISETAQQCLASVSTLVIWLHCLILCFPFQILFPWCFLSLGIFSQQKVTKERRTTYPDKGELPDEDHIRRTPGSLIFHYSNEGLSAFCVPRFVPSCTFKLCLTIVVWASETREHQHRYGDTFVAACLMAENFVFLWTGAAVQAASRLLENPVWTERCQKQCRLNPVRAGENLHTRV